MPAMPIYEYACTACGERTEAKQSFDDPPLETCGYCGGKLRKLYSPVGIVFKGSGFYATDGKRSKVASDDKEKKAEDKAGEKPTDKKDAAGAKKSSSSASSEGTKS